MSRGDIVVGNNPSTRKSKPNGAENLDRRTDTSRPTKSGPADVERHCGAMSQQRGDLATISTPQKFVRLVGCRDPKARPSSGR